MCVCVCVSHIFFNLNEWKSEISFIDEIFWWRSRVRVFDFIGVGEFRFLNEFIEQKWSVWMRKSLRRLVSRRCASTNVKVLRWVLFIFGSSQADSIFHRIPNCNSWFPSRINQPASSRFSSEIESNFEPANCTSSFFCASSEETRSVPHDESVRKSSSDAMTSKARFLLRDQHSALPHSKPSLNRRTSSIQDSSLDL